MPRTVDARVLHGRACDAAHDRRVTGCTRAAQKRPPRRRRNVAPFLVAQHGALDIAFGIGNIRAVLNLGDGRAVRPGPYLRGRRSRGRPVTQHARKAREHSSIRLRYKFSFRGETRPITIARELLFRDFYFFLRLGNFFVLYYFYVNIKKNSKLLYRYKIVRALSANRSFINAITLTNLRLCAENYSPFRADKYLKFCFSIYLSYPADFP